MRLFVGLPVPRSYRAAFAKLREKYPSLHWHQPDDLHITLRFLGDVEEAQLSDIQEALGRVRVNNFGVEASGFDVFDKDSGVLYCPVLSTRKLNNLVAEITDRLTPLGFNFGMRPYVPHITLARAKNKKDIPQFFVQKPMPLHGSWQADNFSLYRSSQKETGLLYEALSLYPLK